MNGLAVALALALGLPFCAPCIYRGTMGRRRWVRYSRARAGCCAACGYNLRASPLRCPECGAIPDAAERARASHFSFDCGFLRYVFAPLVPLKERTPDFGRYTDRLRKVVGLANNAAVRAGDAALLPRDLLAAIAAEGSGVGAEILRSIGVDLTKIVPQFAPGLSADEPTRLDRWIDESSRLLIRVAITESRFLGDNHVGTEHMVLAMLADPEIADDIFPGAAGPSHHAALCRLLELKADWLFHAGKVNDALAICEALLIEPTVRRLAQKARMLQQCPEEKRSS